MLFANVALLCLSFWASPDMNQRPGKRISDTFGKCEAAPSKSLGFTRRESVPGKHINAKVARSKVSLDMNQSLGFVGHESAPDKCIILGKVAPLGSFAGCESAPGKCINAKWHLRRFLGFVECESASGNFVERESAPGKVAHSGSFVGHESTLVETYKYRSRPLK
ncbi:4102_t:CDS:10, partial [Dentiscutata heterogama]